MNDGDLLQRNAQAQRERRERAEIIRKRMAEGHTVAQVADELGINASTVSSIIRDFKLPKQSRAGVGNKQRVNQLEAVEHTVNDFEDAAHTIRMLGLNPHGADTDTLKRWQASMRQSIKVFEWLRKRIASELAERERLDQITGGTSNV